jgi:K+-transporting ATPase KdpF subunit
MSFSAALSEEAMEYAIAGVITACLFVYLVYALLRPEKF